VGGVCAEHVLNLFESAKPSDSRPRHAIEQARAWARGEITMTQSRTAAAMRRRGPGPAWGSTHAAYAAAQAAAVAHVAAHELGAGGLRDQGRTRCRARGSE